MKRRDFLKLAAGVLASLGLRAALTETKPDAQDDWKFMTGRFDSTTPIDFGELPPLRPFWPMSENGMDWQDTLPDGSIETIMACEPPYMCAFNGDTVIESFDGGVTWSVRDNANAT